MKRFIHFIIILLVLIIPLLLSMQLSKHAVNVQTAQGGFGDTLRGSLDQLKPKLMSPLQIEVMRQQSYPGSELTIEQTLTPGVSYAQYVASYQSEGYKINGLLTVPNGEKPDSGWPVIIFNHGYIPPDEYRTTERYVAYVDAFARYGYIVFKPDYRGHGDSEGDAEGAYGSGAYTTDVLNAVTSLKTYPDADPSRIGMWGHSMGGYLTLRSMVISKDIKAGVVWAGVVGSYADMLKNWRRPNASPFPLPSGARRWRQLFVEQFGDPDKNPEFWNSISANSYLSDVSGPLQLHHGTSDSSVPVSFSQSLEKQMKEAGKAVEYYEYVGDDHNLSQSFSLAMQRSIKFFDTYVKGNSS